MGLGPNRVERPTRLRVLRGESPRAVNWPVRTASKSDAYEGNDMSSARTSMSRLLCGLQPVAVGATWVASKTGGLNVRNDDDCETDPRTKSLQAGICGTPTHLDPCGEGRCREGSNGYMHLASHRGTDPGIQGKTRRDNVGKGLFAAGAGSNLQRPAGRGAKPKPVGGKRSGA